MQGPSINNNDEMHYYKRRRKKKNGRYRVIHAPSPKLKEFQKEFSDWIYSRFEKEFKKNSQITGFVKGKSIADNAKPHLNKDWVLTLDIKDFFPSTNRKYIKLLMYKEFNNRSLVKRIFSRIFNRKYYKGLTHNEVLDYLSLDVGLPQGSPASPVIANLIGVEYIDEFVKKILLEWSGFLYGISYTRYADDLTISFNDGRRENAEEIARSITDTLSLYSIYKIKAEKTKIKHRSQRQTVTGVIVNGREPRIDGRLMNKMRAVMHNAKIKSNDLNDEMKGMLSFIHSINKKQYNKLVNQGEN